ncbi:MAG: hypothetical protein RL660_729 [Bacteroidota bacterium]|jgi:hypothetical protein
MTRKFLGFAFLALICVNKNSAAQNYVQGDIDLSISITATHDSNTCSTIANENWFLVINNSFVGDVVEIVDMNAGMLLTTNTNSSGQNPWYVPVAINTINFIYSDKDVINGYANFYSASMYKVISGSDTLYNVFAAMSFPVPNPCQYGNVSGNVYLDYNNDCIYNTGDKPLNSVLVNTTSYLSGGGGGVPQYEFTNSAGNYNAKLQESWLQSYTVSIPPTYSFYFPYSTCAVPSYSFTTLPQTGVDFALNCGTNVDLAASNFNCVLPRPALPFYIYPRVSNVGCDTISGVLTLVKDNRCNYNALLSNNPATYVNGDTLQWNYTNLTNLSANGYWNSLMSAVHLTPNNTVNIGDTLCFQIFTPTPSNDAVPSNNSGTMCLPVVNSYDPNDKHVLPKGEGPNGDVPPSTTDFEYRVNFQNTGTAPAINISIVDTLDANFDSTTFKIVGASHTMHPEWVRPNVVRFRFFGINLPDSNANEPASHGFVSYRIKAKPNQALGTQFTNTAYIYFDTNPAIVTNTTKNTYAVPNSISTSLNDLRVSAYPNPFTDYLEIEGLDNSDQICVTDLMGSTIYNVHANQGKHLDMRSLSPGIYILTIQHGETKKALRVVKQ